MKIRVHEGLFPKPVARRRVIKVMAAALAGAGSSLAGLPCSALARHGPADGTFGWRGQALGAEGSITIAHSDRNEAERLVRLCLREIERLENIFSLYRRTSEISRLNSAGFLQSPSHDMVRLLSVALRFCRLSEGAFDISVQPLWRLYADHFSKINAAPEGPNAESRRKALDLIDYRQVQVSSKKVALGRPGMALTLNGIAQGYIADRVADILRHQGLRQVFVELGETRAIGGHPSGGPWRIGLENPLARGQVDQVVEVSDGAVATSGGYGTPFEPSGRHHHLFDPRSGQSAHRHHAVSVIAEEAATADALSTALYMITEAEARPIIRGVPRVSAIFTRLDMKKVTIG